MKWQQNELTIILYEKTARGLGNTGQFSQFSAGAFVGRADYSIDCPFISKTDELADLQNS